MAVTFAVVAVKATSVASGFDSVTVKLSGFDPLLPSLIAAGLAIESVASSLLMVPVALALPRIALTGFDSVTVKVSFGSTRVSPFTCTVTVWEVSPAANVRSPETAT